MNQHEQDWIDLGRHLKDYEPTGDSGEDFADFQQFQQTVAAEGHRSGWRKILPVAGLLLVAVFGLGFLLWPDQAADTEGLPSEVIAASAQVQGTLETAKNTKSLDAAATTVSEEERAGASVTEDLVPGQEQAAAASFQIPAVATSNIRPGTFPQSVAPAIISDSRMAGSTNTVGPVVPAERAIRNPPSPFEAPETETAIAQLPVTLNAYAVIAPLPLVPVELLSLPAVTPQPPAPTFSVSSRPLRITMGAGLSSHWRGAGFLQDVDQGLYASIGLRKDFSSRFGAEIQLGYRDQALMLAPLGDTEEVYWSHYTDASSWVDDQGDTHRYQYEGIVEGHRAVELNLLVHYRPLPRVGLSVGGRFALPTLHVERLVGGSDVQNPYKKFVEEQPLVRKFDYGVLFGAEYVLTRQLAIQTSLQFGLVDLIEDAGEERERFNHSNALSVGLRYSFE